MRPHSLLMLATALLLTACAAPTVLKRGSANESSSIQTRGFDDAPATRAPVSNSLPLSQMNTPDAIAARQAQAGGGGYAPGGAYGQPPSTTMRGEPAAAHAQVPGFEKGGRSLVRAGAALRSRPNSGSDAIQSLVLDEQVLLDTRVYNAEGYWWFVSAGSEDGWLSQADLLQP